MYHLAARLAALAEDGRSYKNALYSNKNIRGKLLVTIDLRGHSDMWQKLPHLPNSIIGNAKGAFFLVTNAVQKKDIIDKIISEVGFMKQSDDKLWLVRVLVTELLWGKGKFPLRSPSFFKKIEKLKPKMLEILPKSDREINEGNSQIPRYIRINPEEFTKDSASCILKEKGFQEVPRPDSYEGFLEALKSLKASEFIFDFHVPYLIVFNRRAKLDSLSPVSFIRQDKASCLVSLLLAPVPGTTILDMCAAPGYKTLHAASLIYKMGKVFSVDRNKARFQTLQQTCKDFKLGECVQPLHMDALKTSESICPNVEYILVDPPCSGTGICNILMKHTADEDRLRKLSNLQAMILKHALTEFPRARRLVYSTCSTMEPENEGVVRECRSTAQASGWEVVPLGSFFKGSFQTGVGNLGLRLNPSRDLTNGFYIALFERSVPPGHLLRSVDLTPEPGNKTIETFPEEDSATSSGSESCEISHDHNTFTKFKKVIKSSEPKNKNKSFNKPIKRLGHENSRSVSVPTVKKNKKRNKFKKMNTNKSRNR